MHAARIDAGPFASGSSGDVRRESAEGRLGRAAVAILAIVVMLGATGCASFGGHGRRGSYRHHHGHGGHNDFVSALVEVAIDVVVAIADTVSSSSHSEVVVPEPAAAPEPEPVEASALARASDAHPPVLASALQERGSDASLAQANVGRVFSADDASASLRIAASYAARCRGGSHGPVEARVVYSPGGGVAEVALVGPGVTDHFVADCVRSRLGRARTRAYDGPTGIVTARFDVTPDGAGETAVLP